MDLGIEGLTAVAEIGRGGFGVVHLAIDEAHGRNVAVKLLTGNLDDSARRQFDRERRAMGTLSGHPSIGVVHTSGFNEFGQPYIVMEYLDGGSLENRLAQGPMASDEVMEIGLALSDAIASAHASGVLHLDLKPANVLRSSFGQPKLVDFGIASIMGEEHATTTIRATPAYAAPEIFDAKPATERSDVYGLAATMYALLVGTAPYTTGAGDPALHILREIAIAPVPTVERSDVPPALRRLLASAMAKDPAERPQSMSEFRDRLREIQSSPTQPPGLASEPVPPVAASSNDGQRLGFVLLGLAGFVIVVAAAVLFSRGDEGQPEPTPSTTDQPAVPTTTGAPTTSIAPSRRAVPDVRTLSESAARTAISNAGFTPAVRPHCYLEASGTTPPLGSTLEPGTTVTIEFDPCVVPNFIGLRLPEAIARIEEINAIQIQWNNHCDDLIQGQSVESGTTVTPFEVTIQLDLPTVC